MQTAEARIRDAREEDRAQAENLLREASLPLDGLREHFRDALVAVQDGQVVGCVALEIYGPVALLRSLVVSPGLRGQRLGERLTAGAVDRAKGRGVRDLYLLTQTAVDFFPRFGFAVEDRASAPKSLGESEEFKSACPASAVMMHVRIPGR
jgi:amino-acid N-acetyltransferase